MANIITCTTRDGETIQYVDEIIGSGSMKDEHLVPGRGGQPCAEFLRRITAAGFTGDIAVEVNTRRGGGKNRDVDLAESLAFARTHCAVAEPHV